jgi:hypothetical protein
LIKNYKVDYDRLERRITQLTEQKKLDNEKLLTAQITTINITEKLEKMIKIVDQSRAAK